jgi:hypothetical protein
MAQFKDVAVVAGTGESGASKVKKALAGDDDVKTIAWLAFEFMLTEARKANAEEILDAEDGMPWLRWHGTLANALRELGYITKDYRKSTPEDDQIRRNTSKFLQKTANAICVYRTNGLGSTAPIWAIRTVFRETDAPHGAVDYKALGRLPGEPVALNRRGEQPAEPAAPVKPAVTATVPSAPRQIAPKPGRLPAAQAAPRRYLPCPRCLNGKEWDSEYLFRHNVKEHGLIPEHVLLDNIRQCGSRVRSPELAELLSQACGGGTVSTAYVGRILLPYVNDPASPVTATRAFKDFWYDWDEAVAAMAAPASPAPAVDPVVQPVSQETASSPMPTAAVAAFQPSPPSSNGSHAPSPSTAPDVRLLVVASAFQRAEDAIQVVYEALDEAKAAAEDIAAENSKLRSYRERVKGLLTAVEEPAPKR